MLAPFAALQVEGALIFLLHSWRGGRQLRGGVDLEGRVVCEETRYAAI